MYRHMKNIPENGKFLFLDSGWMDQTIREYQSGSFSIKEYERRLEEICVFERQLCDNGYLLVKLFLHIGQEEQHKRIQHLLKNPDTGWRVSGTTTGRAVTMSSALLTLMTTSAPPTVHMLRGTSSTPPTASNLSWNV